MGHETGEAKITGKIGEHEADEALKKHGFGVLKPPGKDCGVDREIFFPDNPQVVVKAQIKGRRERRHPRWFQVTVTSAQIKYAVERGQDIEQLWRQRILMVDFWLLVSIPLNEIWVMPSQTVVQLAEHNAPFYPNRKDNQFDKAHYNDRGKIAKKQKELNLDNTTSRGVELTMVFRKHLNNFEQIRELLLAKDH